MGQAKRITNKTKTRPQKRPFHWQSYDHNGTPGRDANPAAWQDAAKVATAMGVRCCLWVLGDAHIDTQQQRGRLYNVVKHMVRHHGNRCSLLLWVARYHGNRCGPLLWGCVPRSTLVTDVAR